MCYPFALPREMGLWCLIIAVICLGTAWLDSPAALAQTTGESEAATPADTAETPAGPPREDISLAVWMCRSLGPFYGLVFLSISIALVAVVVMNLLSIRRDNVVSATLVEQFEDRLNHRQYQEAYDMAKGDESFLGRVLAAGLARLAGGYDQAVEAMENAGEDENMKMEHRLSYMALIATIAPMFGLLGTVHGMISSFRVIAISHITPEPWQLAQGVSTALFTTLVGLFLAIPALTAHNLLRNRAARLNLEAAILSENLMSRFARTKKENR